jgi:rubrerythrin
MGNTPAPDVRIKAWRCQICGEVVFATECPSECPFCGSEAVHIEFANQVTEEPNRPGDFTPEDRHNLETALKAELEDMEKYRVMSKAAPADWMRQAYKRISRQEAEHASIFARLLGVGSPKRKVMLNPPPYGEMARQSVMDELNASAIYEGYAKTTKDARLKVVWRALSTVENNHYILQRFGAH